jgi:protein NirF
VKRTGLVLASALLAAAIAGASGVGSRVYVVERASGRLAIYDLDSRSLLERRIENLGDLKHATMIFTPDLRYGFLATRGGKVSRIDLETARSDGEVLTSESSIDNAISQDGRFLAVAEYAPGGLTILDTKSLEVLKKHSATRLRDGKETLSRVTGVVDAPGNRFVCVLMEAGEIWIVEARGPEFPITHRIPLDGTTPYDAMITPDGRYYLVGHLESSRVSLLDLQHPEAGVRSVSFDDPGYERSAPAKLPHLASWAVAGSHVFVPLVGEKRLAVLDRSTFQYQRSIPLRGHPVYAVRSPTEREIWVSFSGEADDAFVQVIDADRLEVVDSFRVGARIYHMEFTPRGSHVLVTANRENKLFLIDAFTRRVEDSEDLESPSGIFGVWRAFRIGL